MLFSERTSPVDEHYLPVAADTPLRSSAGQQNPDSSALLQSLPPMHWTEPEPSIFLHLHMMNYMIFLSSWCKATIESVYEERPYIEEHLHDGFNYFCFQQVVGRLTTSRTRLMLEAMRNITEFINAWKPLAQIHTQPAREILGLRVLCRLLRRENNLELLRIFGTIFVLHTGETVATLAQNGDIPSLMDFNLQLRLN